MATVTRRIVRNAVLGWSYGDQGSVDRGQVIELRGYPGDEKLLRLGYLEEKPPKKDDPLFACSVCGKEFISQATRTAHGNLRHPDAELTWQESEARFAASAARQAKTAPLRLDQTMASRQ